MRILSSALCSCVLLVAPAVLQAAAPRGLDQLTIAGQEEAIHPLEARLLADAADGRLDEHSLLAAALVAEGETDPLEVGRLERQFSQRTKRLGDYSNSPDESSPRDQARAMLALLYQEMLTGEYRTDASQVRESLAGRGYNCVSATLLFNCLAREAGLEAVAVESPGHVASRLIVSGDTIDVETTCPTWFDHDGESTVAHVVSGRAFASAATAPRDGAEPRVLSDVQLLAIVYYNRGVDRLGTGQFSEAVGLLRRAYRLDAASPSIRGNLLAAVNNGALELSGQGFHREAVETLAGGLAAAPEHQSFTVNYLAVHRVWLERMYDAGQFQTAVAAIERAALVLPDEPFFGVARLDAYRRWGRVLILEDRFDAALARLDDLRRRHPIEAEARSIEAAAINDAALARMRAGDFPVAIAALERGCRRQPENQLMADNYRAVLMHWADEAFTRADYPEGVRRTQLALARLPQDETLRGNVRYGYHRWLAELAALGQWDAARGVLRRARREDPESPHWRHWQSQLGIN